MTILSTIKDRVLAFARCQCHPHPYSQLTTASPCNSQLIIDNALEVYKKRTRNDLLSHPLAAQLEACTSPSDILAVLQQQVQGPDQPRSGDEQWTKWLDPIANVLFAFSARLGGMYDSLVCPSKDIRSYANLALSYSFSRNSPLRMLSSPGSAFSFQCVSSSSLACVVEPFAFLRPLRMFELARTLFMLWRPLSTLKCFSDVSRCSRKCGRLRK